MGFFSNIAASMMTSFSEHNRKSLEARKLGEMDESCAGRVFSNGAYGLAYGALFGTFYTAWQQGGSRTPMKFSTAIVRVRNIGAYTSIPMILFAVTDCTAATFRGKEDAFNSALGGAVAGAFLGTMTGSIKTTMAASGSFALAMLAFDLAGAGFSDRSENDLYRINTFENDPHKH